MSPNDLNDLDSYQNSYVSVNNFSFDEDDNDSTSFIPNLLKYRTCHVVRFIFFVYSAICVGWLVVSTHYRVYLHNDADGTMLDVRNGIDSDIPELIWSDEFDGNSLDLTKWSFVNGNGCDVGLCGWGNNELEVYTPSNAWIKDGKLVIEAKQVLTPKGSISYTSSKIISRGKADFGIASCKSNSSRCNINKINCNDDESEANCNESTAARRFEAKIRLPWGHGIWPAFWMLPTNDVHGGWPKSGEIDIMEYIGKDGTNTVHGTVHYGLDGAQHQYSESGITLLIGDLNETFHTYAVDRKAGEMRWYIDDIEYSSITKNEMQPYLWPFDEEFHFIINLAVGGNWPGNPVIRGNSSVPASLFPQTLEVDYVRVYESVFPRVRGKSIVNCKAKGVMYQVVDFDSFGISEAVLEWSVPNGATITDGNGSSRIKVDFDSTINHSNINDSEIIRVQLVSGVGLDSIQSIGLDKLQNGIGLRVKIIDFDGRCSNMNSTNPISQFNFNCGRPDTCTEYVLHRTTDEYSCGERIKWLMSQGMDEMTACAEVGYHQFHGHCGPCNPK